MRDAVIALGICGVIAVALLVTHNLAVLWLLALLVLVIF